MTMRWCCVVLAATIDPCGDDAPPLRELAYEVRLYVGGSWDHAASFTLDLSEHVLALAEVSLLDARDRPQALIAVGTGYHTSRGEDANALGRVSYHTLHCGDAASPHYVLCDVGFPQLLLLQYYYTEDGQQALRQFYAKSFKGLVTAVAFMQAPRQRYIIVAGNNKMLEVLAWKLERSGSYELIKVGFIETFNYITHIQVVKSFIMYSDSHKSVHFLRLTESGERSVTLSYLAKDYHAAAISASHCLSDGKSLLFAAADMHKNVQFFQYEASAAKESSIALPLVRKADFNMSALVCNMVTAKLAATSPAAPPNRFGLLFGTVEGGLGALLPVDEVTFKRLLALQKLMTYALPHAGGLNPKDFRLFRAPESTRLHRDKHVVDGSLVWKYVSLDRRLQREIARAINTTVDRILASLRDVELSLNVF